MILRKLTASFLVIMFVVLAVPNFVVYGISRTYLNRDFYSKDELVQKVYDFTLDKTVEVLQRESDFFKGYFSASELRTQVEKVFSKKIFTSTLNDFADQMDLYKKDPSRPLVLSLQTLRANLLTVGNNLAYLIYQKLPTCSNDELLEISEHTVPACVPKSVPYEEVVKPLTDNFEATVYNTIPEELSNIDRAFPIAELVKIEKYRDLSFLVLIGIIALIALVIYGKISSILAYVSTGFVMAGIAGYGFSYALGAALTGIKGDLGDPRSQEFLLYLLKFLVTEVQRMSIMFGVVGLALLLIRFVIKRTVEVKTNPVSE